MNKQAAAPSLLRVALCQMTSSDVPAHNLEQIEQHLMRGVPQGAQSFFFPENSLYLRIEKGPIEHTFDAQSPEIKTLERWSREKKVHLLMGSVPWKVDRQVGNCTLWISPESGARAVYQKMHLFDVDVEGQTAIRESAEFAAGAGPRMMELAGWKVGLSICYDLRFSELYSQYALREADIILIPSAFLQKTGQAHWHVLNRARAIENQCYVIAAAQGGEHCGRRGGTRHTYGHSLVVDPWGEILAESNDASETPVVELDVARISQVRRQIPMKSHRHKILVTSTQQH